MKGDWAKQALPHDHPERKRFDRLKGHDRLKRVYDILSRPKCLRSDAEEDDMIRIILAEIRGLRNGIRKAKGEL